MMKRKIAIIPPSLRKYRRTITLLTIIALTVMALASIVLAQGPAPYLPPTSTENVNPGPIAHPVFPILDEAGNNVLDTGNPMSTIKTCGSCHDAEFIATHSFHADMGMADMSLPGQVENGHPWDTSPGPYGKWSPLTYRYLTPGGDSPFDLGTASWVQLFGPRHVGGGPAATDVDGTPLTEVSVSGTDPTTHVLDENGDVTTWDWKKSGIEEMNCFLCHIGNPNTNARNFMLETGRFRWANTATLFGTGIVNIAADGTYTWNADAFDADGNLLPKYTKMRDPKNDACGQCHGDVYSDPKTPVVLNGEPGDNTATTGEIFSPQRINVSGMNIAQKETLDRAFDIHAERAVGCVDCHPSQNNPAYFRGNPSNSLSHLIFDARRMDLGAYLKEPSHQFAKGQTTQGINDPETNNTMRDCEGCHDPYTGHQWLPYKSSHFNSLSCQTCHIPHMYAPAIQQVDWTVITVDGTGKKLYRGINGPLADPASLVTGFKPSLALEKQFKDEPVVSPFNMISSWYWVTGTPEHPVREMNLHAAYLDGDNYRADVLAVFDSNGDGALSNAELRLDTPEKEALIKQNLEALGVSNPHIVAETQPYDISHDVTNSDFAVKDCTVCHSKNSVLAQPMTLASYMPGGAVPAVFGSDSVANAGEIITNDDGSVAFKPNPAKEGLYIFGYSSVWWIDWLGILAFLGVLGGVVVHGGLRYYFALKMTPPHHKLKRVYMYDVYERLWHWLQALAIFLLIFTGLIIHKPDMFGIFSFPQVVLTHNVLGFLLATNAALALFYNLVSGEIKQYLPQPRGYFNQMITQAQFYVNGIFKGAEHPFEKTKSKKLNPLQQITYFGLLNVLLPLQVITGILIWGMQHWPQFDEALGGLPVLAPIHSLIAWLLASFIVMHMYLTTTGHTPLAGIKSMIYGWDDVEVLNGGTPRHVEATSAKKDHTEEA